MTDQSEALFEDLGIDLDAIHALLGFTKRVPLHPLELAASLRVTFFPHTEARARELAFAQRFEAALRELGATIVPWDEAREQLGTSTQRFVIVTTGEATDGNLAMDYVRYLRSATLLSILEGTCPADQVTGLQNKLNTLVQALSWQLAHSLIYVNEGGFTFCCMNGSITRFSEELHSYRHVLALLVPKLAAPVVPPRLSDFEVHSGSLDLAAPDCVAAAADFATSAALWASTGLMLFHTPISSLRFRSPAYQRIVEAYLDHRSGMSYGFLARQLPTPVTPAIDLAEAEHSLGRWDFRTSPVRVIDGQRFICVRVQDRSLVVPVPEVKVLATRSGCDKSNLDLRRDIMRMGLSGGKIVLETPPDFAADIKPSYDTQTILANAMANAIVASILARLRPAAAFSARLSANGAGQAHWHGSIDPTQLPAGFMMHGQQNPPVSCSTAQSAIYTIAGKFGAVVACLRNGIDFLGDLHVEPLHGVNLSGESLTFLAGLVRKLYLPRSATNDEPEPEESLRRHHGSPAQD